ncbi:MAG: glycosyltransferase family 61 protein [Gammaproteobacteria bacterium]|nr:MAG: glycosyltransferase family 61 protein [Gammaproteobacteria bacterium]
MKILILIKRIIYHFVAIFVRRGQFGVAMILLRSDQLFSRSSIESRFASVVGSNGPGLDKTQSRNRIFPAREGCLKPVVVKKKFPDSDNNSSNHVIPVRYPPVDIIELSDVGVVGGTELIDLGDGRVLYDEIAYGNPDRFGCKCFGIIPRQAFGLFLPAFHKGRLLVSTILDTKQKIPVGIHLCKDHSGNYFHWLFECLPRAVLSLRDPRYEGIPLIVDAHLPSQNLEALKQISGDREIHTIERRHQIWVDRLIYPGVLSYTHDYYGVDARADDFLVAPEAISLLREAFVPTGTSNPQKKRIFVARDRASYRRLRNEKEIHQALTRLGFIIVRPETMTFTEQVDLFSEAEVIVGPTGAGMSNMIFAPEGCKVVVLAAATKAANHYLFSQVGQHAGHELMYVEGRALRPNQLHSDYHVSPREVLAALEEMGVI